MLALKVEQFKNMFIIKCVFDKNRLVVAFDCTIISYIVYSILNHITGIQEICEMGLRCVDLHKTKKNNNKI